MEASNLRPRFHLGKINNKYLIVDIFSYAYISNFEMHAHLFTTSREMRCLLKEGFRWIKQNYYISPFNTLIRNSNCKIT